MQRNHFGRAFDPEIRGISLRTSPRPYRPVTGPRFPSNTAKQRKPATVHFSDEPADSVGGAKSSSILKAPDTVGNENAPQTDGCGENSGEESEAQESQEMYKFRDYYNRAQNGHTIHMVTPGISYEDNVPNSINGHVLGSDSPPIPIGIGSSRSVYGRQWAEWRFPSTKIA